jgi:hypothetical protein
VKQTAAAAQAARSARQAQMAAQGPKLWAALHQRALGFVPARAALQLGWLKAFARQISCGDCRLFYVQWLRANPPVLTTSETFFDWTVDMHNAVNSKLGKPELSYADALIAWSPKPAPPAAS